MMTPRPTVALDRLRRVLALLTLACLSAGDELQRRWQRARAGGDAGSDTVEKAVITAVVLGLAVGLAAAISAVVGQYRGQIQP